MYSPIRAYGFYAVVGARILRDQALEPLQRLESATDHVLWIRDAANRLKDPANAPFLGPSEFAI